MSGDEKKNKVGFYSIKNTNKMKDTTAEEAVFLDLDTKK